jgi:GNAT superfamily N-acetyltransferase
MLRTAGPQDLSALRAFFGAANDAPYDLAAVIEEKCFGSGIDGRPVVRVLEVGGRIVGASVICGRWLRLLAVARDQRRRGIGSRLVADADAMGVTVIAAEPGNYFTPGVPMADEGSRAFFHARGYIETRWTWNLEVGLESIAAEGDVVRPMWNDAERILSFVEQEFGRIWRFEAQKAFEREIPTIFVTEESGAITGFAVHDVNNRGLGFFGPTGVASSMRGRGFGCRLLLASLADLRRLGYSRAIIPWTEALEFYRKCCGAEPAHRFIAFAKPRP